MGHLETNKEIYGYLRELAERCDKEAEKDAEKRERYQALAIGYRNAALVVSTGVRLFD